MPWPSYSSTEMSFGLGQKAQRVVDLLPALSVAARKGSREEQEEGRGKKHKQFLVSCYVTLSQHVKSYLTHSMVLLMT